MKKIIAIIILSLYFTIPSKAEDIKDFQIEGISIGDSLLKYLNENQIILPIQINGKRRAEIKISKSLSNKEVENLALNHQNIIKFLSETPKKIIYIPNKIINIVI